MYNGIKMRSRLEADFAAFLDRSGADWEYEPVCFAGPHSQWLPDFRITENEKRIYVEVKPASLLGEQIDPTLERMTVAWLTEPTAILHLALWPFGEPVRSVNIMGIPHEDGDADDEPIWWHSEGAGETIAWPGMGQLARWIDDGLLDGILREIPEEEPR